MYKSRKTNLMPHPTLAKSKTTHSPLLSPNFILLMAGEALSLFGNAMLRFACSMWVLDQTGSATIFSTLLALAIVPTIVLSPLGGIVADRVNRKALMVALDVISGTVVLTATLGFPALQAHAIPGIATLLIVLSVLDATESPAVTAAIPQMLGRGSATVLRQAQAVNTQISAVMQIVPAFAGGALYAVLGIRRMFTITTVCFLATAALECFIKLPTVTHADTTDTTTSSPLRDLAGAITFLERHRGLIRLMAFTTALNFLLDGMSSVGAPAVIRTVLGFSAGTYGTSDGIIGTVSLLGTFLTLALASKLTLRQMPLSIHVAALGFAPIALAFALPAGRWTRLVIFVASLSFVNLAVDFCNVIIGPTFTMLVPDELLGKVSSLSTTICQCAIPLGQITYGLLFDHMPVVPIALGTGICLALMGLALTPTARTLSNQLT